jgi:hypothetical protein
MRGGEGKEEPPNMERGDSVGDGSLQSHSGANPNPKTAKNRGSVPKGGLPSQVSLVKLGVKDFRNLISRFSVNYDWQRWRLFVIRNSVRNCWLERRDVEYWMYCIHIVRESEHEWATAGLNDDLIRSNVSLRKVLQRAGHTEVFRFDEDLVANSEVGLWNMLVIHRPLVMFLSSGNVASEVLVKVVQFHHKLASPCGGEVSFGMRGEVWVVTFVGIERWNSGGGGRRIVVSEFRYQKKAGPVAMLVVAIYVEVLFQGLVSMFCLAIAFGVVTRSKVEVHVKCFAQCAEKGW